jgi:hypothetical protein
MLSPDTVLLITKKVKLCLGLQGANPFLKRCCFLDGGSCNCHITKRCLHLSQQMS